MSTSGMHEAREESRSCPKPRSKIRPYYKPRSVPRPWNLAKRGVMHSSNYYGRGIHGSNRDTFHALNYGRGTFHDRDLGDLFRHTLSHDLLRNWAGPIFYLTL